MLEVKVGNRPTKKGEVGLDREARVTVQPIEEAPIPLEGSTDIFLEAELILKMEEMQSGGDSTPIEAFG